MFLSPHRRPKLPAILIPADALTSPERATPGGSSDAQFSYQLPFTKHLARGIYPSATLTSPTSTKLGTT